jgi:hypothetical protein
MIVVFWAVVSGMLAVVGVTETITGPDGCAGGAPPDDINSAFARGLASSNNTQHNAAR